MSERVVWDKARPKCPVCGAPLERLGPRGGRCPAGYVDFEFDEDHAEKTMKLKINALGVYEYTVDWKLTQLSNGHGCH